MYGSLLEVYNSQFGLNNSQLRFYISQFGGKKSELQNRNYFYFIFFIPRWKQAPIGMGDIYSNNILYIQFIIEF